MDAVRLEVKVHIVTGAVTSAQNIVRACHRADLDVAGIVLEPLASAKAVLTEEECEIGVALVDVGGGTTDIAVFTNDAIKYTGVIALGGHNVTNDIAYGLRTPMSSAEKIKIKYGCALADMVPPDDIIEVPSVGGRESRQLRRQVLAEICEPRMEEIFSLVDQELVRSGSKNLIGAGVVLTGGCALLEGCEELGEQVFMMSDEFKHFILLLVVCNKRDGFHKISPFSLNCLHIQYSPFFLKRKRADRSERQFVI